MILENAAHVVVIGSGLAGLTSTIEAARNGAKVTLIEKEASIGGNSAKATSGINGSETKYQMDAGIKDSIEEFENDTLKSGGDFCDKSLVKVLASQSKSAIEWLSSFGLNLSVLSQCGGHSVKRTHREPDVNGRPAPVGWDIISALRKHVENDLKDQVTVKVNTKLTDMVVENDRLAKIVTVDSQGTAEEFEADSFVLTTGGFSADKSYNDSLLKEFAPNLLSLATTNGKWATGDGVKIARKIGVSLVDMDKVQVHPTGFVSLEDPENHQKFLAPEALRGHGGILVNSFGNRFCNELGLRDEVTGSI
ncbi:FAD/NAD(P)-binding domain-containing protein, partial [Rozella allomycis CSF55]